MTSRERVLSALNHREPDRVPFDMGGTVVSGIHKNAYCALREYLELPVVEPKVVDVFQQIVQVDDDLMNQLKVDVRNVSPRSSGTHKIDVKDMGDYTYFYDEFQIGWRMPKQGGFYYDMFSHPLAGNIGLEDIENYDLPDPLNPARFTGVAEAAQKVVEEEKRAVVVGSMSAGTLEIVAWTRGFADYFADLASNEKLTCAMLDRVLDQKIKYWGRIFELLGDRIDVAQEADDFAGQDKMLISPVTYRRLVKPRHKILFDFIHKNSPAKVFFHSCGAIRPVIPDLIEAGVDILNPIQVSARGMDPAELKREFGKDIVFWGGGIDTQKVLHAGTPDEVKVETRKRLDALMTGGGFIFTPVHNIQPNVPPENIMMMWETVQEYGVY